MWGPHTAHDISTLENVQHQAACGSHVEAGGILLLRGGINPQQNIVLMCYTNLTDRRNYLSVSTLYDILNKRTSPSFSDYLVLSS